MSYRFQLDESVPGGIRRIAVEQIDQALDHLIHIEDDIDEAIHDARKRFKKIRAVIRLVRDEIGDEVYHRENTFYRDAGRELAELRKSVVAVQTLDHLIEHYDSELEADAFQNVRNKLVNHHNNVRQCLIEEKTVEMLVVKIQAAKKDMAELPVVHDDFAAIQDGLKRVYKRGTKALDRAYSDPTPENFHEWRKRVKYLWYQMRILKPLWPDMLDELADSVHDLADYLGDEHDLADFEHMIKRHPSLFESEDAAQALIGLSARWRKELEAKAHSLGERIYAEKPKAFTKRMETYWQVIRSNG